MCISPISQARIYHQFFVQYTLRWLGMSCFATMTPLFELTLRIQFFVALSRSLLNNNDGKLYALPLFEVSATRVFRRGSQSQGYPHSFEYKIERRITDNNYPME